MAESDRWTCEACGGTVAQPEGVAIASAVRGHARAAGHPPAGVRRERANGLVQRWHVPETPGGPKPPRPACDRCGTTRAARTRISRDVYRCNLCQGRPPAPARQESEPAAGHAARTPAADSPSRSARWPSSAKWALAVFALLLTFAVTALIAEHADGGQPARSVAAASGPTPSGTDDETSGTPSLATDEDLPDRTWAEAWTLLREHGRGHVVVRNHATGDPLNLDRYSDGYEGRASFADWPVCTAELTTDDGLAGYDWGRNPDHRLSLQEDYGDGIHESDDLWLVTIADPDDGGCSEENVNDTTGVPGPEPTDDEADDATDDDTAGDDTAGDGPAAAPGPQRGVHPGAWCGNPGALGYTDAGTLMKCQYGKGADYRWRRA
ncbi:hypothetical protein P8A18_13370 [Streptomyces castrisilvae]|uniref:SCP domain-containing protein n=1 Tax=Streptomyces castrisilvae TaxID=3033811 RepID=A0ABY9HIL6_9ACTN|nr:hypothetical protein [Streptomyces sp. Mut1]WLQ34367.1 hypothetical protein P8A18_13370 [Streptomyces sp. Mut1]